eukprot:365884-Chlamydomonas_euryale.AAC.8
MELELFRHDLIQTSSCAKGTMAVRTGRMRAQDRVHAGAHACMGKCKKGHACMGKCKKGHACMHACMG